jgi:hypothetical protein
MLNLGFDTAYTKSLMLSEGRNADYLDTPTLLIRKIRDYKTFTGFLDLQTKMNNLFVQYKDYLGNTPFANSRIEFTVLQGNQIKSTFTLNISKTLTQLNYNAIFYDSLSNAQTPNRWTEKLYFSPQYSFTSIPNMSYSLIKNAQAISDNQIKLEDGINNAFTFKTYSDINGLHTNTDIYEVKIVIPPGIYTQNQLYTAINTQFLANPLTQYSKVGSFTERNKEYTRFDVNIYKSFTTKDYRLVFYDPLSFAQCNSSGANKTIQNAKWDSTLGWILGFRSQPVYYLDEYTSISDPSQLIYFNSSNTNQCILNSDTCVSVSLFNSFMIIFDDFNQNHLNDGLVTTSPQQEDLDLGLNNTYVCDPITNTKVLSVVGNTEGKTANQIYALQQKYLAKQTKARPYSTAASIKDVFAIIPITTGKFTVGQIISETGGSLRAQTRIYFGPVNIRRVSVKLMNERGDLLDLNGQNWSFTIEATILTDRPKTASGQQSTSGAKA